MKTINNYIISELKIPEVKVGDEILIGKWKNRRAIVKGMKTNDKGQVVLLTDKGDVKLFHFRLARLMPEKKSVKESLEVIPIIKKTRTHVEEYDVCPHCQQEIQEKSLYAESVDGDYYMYHRPCKDKGPIQKINVKDSMDKLPWNN